jgi:hypothetical protein
LACVKKPARCFLSHFPSSEGFQLMRVTSEGLTRVRVS